MMRLVIEIKENRELNIYAEQDVEVVIVDWKDVREDAESLMSFQKHDPFECAKKELFHKTTGLKQVYP